MDQRAPEPTLADALANRLGQPLGVIGARVPSAMIEGAGRPAGDGLTEVDLTLADGRVRLGILPEAARIDAGHRIFWPRTVDCHTHIDKGQTGPRSPNPNGTFDAAGTAIMRDRSDYFDVKDLSRRAEFQMRAAYAHGTAALRSHVDADEATLDAALDALSDLAADWAGRIDVQLCPFTDLFAPRDQMEGLARAAARVGGALSFYMRAAPGLADALDTAISLAECHGVPLDFHADETLDPASHCLRALAEAVLRTKFQGPVLAGHACALMVQRPEEADRTLDLVADAGIGIVSLPLCNTYLMDRAPGRTPRVRGGTLVHEMLARGIPVALGSDNTRDGYFAYGDLDMVELFRHTAHTLQLDHPVGDWPATVGPTPAKLLGHDGGHIRDGGPADLIVFAARNWSEFHARPQTDRIVLDKGVPIASAPPNFSDLDTLSGMTP
ncbi:MAG: cytosine deaminase [Pseudomonadota bacterium]